MRSKRVRHKIDYPRVGARTALREDTSAVGWLPCSLRADAEVRQRVRARVTSEAAMEDNYRSDLDATDDAADSMDGTPPAPLTCATDGTALPPEPR